MKIAFEEAKSIISVDPELAGYPELRARVDSQFTLEANSVN
jgi:hypothetical protein